jgi:heptaprenyl diphosphate synthase
MKDINLAKITKTGALCALAVMIFMAESLLPPLLFFAPGTRIGLASVFVNLAFIMYGKKEAFAVLAVKCFLGAVFSGNIFSLYYSFPAGLISLTATILLFEFAYPKTGVIAISVSGAILHNIVQIAMAVILTGTSQIFYYVIFVTAAGLIAGIITGTCLYYIVRYVPQRYI